MTIYKVNVNFTHTIPIEANSEEEAIKYATSSMEASGYFTAKNSNYSIVEEYEKEIVCGDHLLLTRDCGCLE